LQLPREMANMTHIQRRIGTAGWGIPTRYAGAFPSEGSHLERYAQLFNAAEINSSFHKPHQRKTYERWADSVPPSFRFAVKLPKAVTHDARLEDIDGPLDRFAGEVTGLGDRLGVLLVQLPPALAFDAGVFDRFLAALRECLDAPVALEPRHASWFSSEVDQMLKAQRIARVAADPPLHGATAPGGWGELAYYRWHGTPRIYYSDYDPATLAAISARLDAAQARGIATWCIFDNTASGAALGNALAML
jgi:uncharacterized protein YecE (DUF72 family)